MRFIHEFRNHLTRVYIFYYLVWMNTLRQKTYTTCVLLAIAPTVCQNIEKLTVYSSFSCLASFDLEAYSSFKFVEK